MHVVRANREILRCLCGVYSCRYLALREHKFLLVHAEGKLVFRYAPGRSRLGATRRCRSCGEILIGAGSRTLARDNKLSCKFVSHETPSAALSKASGSS